MSRLVTVAKPNVIVEQAEVTGFGQAAGLPEPAAWRNQEANTVVFVPWTQENLRLVSARLIMSAVGYSL